MKQFLFSLLLLFTSLPAFSLGQLSGWSERGGQSVITSGSTSTTLVQRSCPGASITIYIDGTSTLATIYTSGSGSATKSNPFTSSSTGYWQFFAADGFYKISFSGCSMSWELTGQRILGIVNKYDLRNCVATSVQAAALGNGVSKPLSGYYSLLAGAQADYPAVAALTDEMDWAVIQKCTSAAAATITAGAGRTSGNTVYLPGGVYVINRSISVNNTAFTSGGAWTSFEGDGMPTLYQTDATKDTLVWTTAGGAAGNFDNVIHGINFYGGRHHIFFANADNEGGKMSIVDFTSRASADYAIDGTSNSSTALNTLLTIERGRFTLPTKILHTTSSPTRLTNIWITGGATVPDDTAFIYIDTNVKVFLDNFYGSPVLDEAHSQRWIDMHGSRLYIDHSRFGGENTGGVPVCNWYTAPNASNGFNAPSPTVFSIQNSDILSGTTNLSGTHVGVLNLQTNVPQVMIFRANAYFFHAPKIVNGGAINFATYFAGFPATYRWKLEDEPDSKWFDDDPTFAGIPPGIPTALRPFLTFGDVEGGGSAPRAITLANGLNSNIAIQQTYKNILLSGPSAGFSIGGFDNPWQGREIRVVYLGAQVMTIVNADASSTAANRIKTHTGGNIANVHAATFIYDQASTTWILMSYN